MRDISELLADLYSRRRQDVSNRNKRIQKILLVADTVTVSSSDTRTITQQTPPYKFGAGSPVGVVGASQCR